MRAIRFRRLACFVSRHLPKLGRLGVGVVILFPFVVSWDDDYQRFTIGETRAGVATRPVTAAVRPIGKPSLLAVLRWEPEPGVLDADGNYVAWIDIQCAVHFVRLSDRRQRVARHWSGSCNQNESGSDLALIRSRAVWSLVGGGLSSAHAYVWTAVFGGAKPREVGFGERGCDYDGCEFRAPIIDSAGGSLAFQMQVGEGGGIEAVMRRFVNGRFEKVAVDAGIGLAVYGKRLAVVEADGSVQLRRLRDGSLLRSWRSRPGRIGDVALSGSSLVIRTRGTDAQGESGGWIHVYATATGHLVRSVRGREQAILSPRPFAGGVVFFSGRTLRYVGPGGKSSPLVTVRRPPVSFDLSGRRAFWIEPGRSSQRQRLYSLTLR